MTKFKAIDIANLYIRMSNDIEGDCIDNLKLNKLLYFAQGWALVKLGGPLFDDEIQAWDYGPVIPAVYHTFKCCGSSPIKEPQDVFDENRLNTKELELLIDVYRKYGKYTGWALKEMTHERGCPWDQVYQRGMNRVIDPEIVRKYFKKQRLETFDVDSINLPEITEVPLEWDDGGTAYDD